MKTFLKYASLAIFAILVGCGGGGEDASSAVSYINWNGSANGESVLDATNDLVKFRSDNGNMVFGNTTYSNIHVNVPGGVLTFNGANIGGIFLIRSSTGGSVAAMVCNDGTLADIFGSEGSLTISCSSIIPLSPISVARPPATGPVASTNTFNVKSGFQRLVASGYSKQLGISGSCSGLHTRTIGAARTSVMFEGIAALSGNSVYSNLVTNCSGSYTSTETDYFDSNYNVLGYSVVGGAYAVIKSSLNLPTTAKVGDVYIVGSLRRYSGIARSDTYPGQDDITLVIEPDTSTTAIVNYITKRYSGTSSGLSLAATYQERYRISADGYLTFLSENDLFSNGTQLIID